MHEKYLGDSFDIVKRFWADRLRPIGPLLAHPRFVSPSIKARFELITGIPVLDQAQLLTRPFGLFLDPHTGIPLPTSSNQSVSASHAPLSFIDTEVTRLGARYVICFDQSNKREAGFSAEAQRNAKQRYLYERGWSSIYYVSHAPFLFASRAEGVLDEIKKALVASGIPVSRLESGLSERSG